MPSYLKLMTLVKRHIDHKIRPRNFEAKTLLETLKIRNRPWENSLYLRESNVPSQKFDVQETDPRFHTSCTETEVISSDAGLRMDGIPALWDLVIEV